MRVQVWKRLGIFSITAILVVGMAACSGDSGSSGGASGVTNSAGETVDLPEIKLENKKVVILTQSSTLENHTFTENFGGEIELVTAADSELYTKFMSMAMGGEAPDLFQQYLQPSLIVKNYLQPVDEWVDLTSPLWQDVKDANDRIAYKGSHYSAITSPSYGGVCWYNKEIFDEYGYDTPQKLLDEGNWTWDTFRDLALKLTVDADKDGMPELWGACINEVDMFLYSCGKHVVSFNPEGKAINNIKSEEIARAMSFYVDINDKDFCIYAGADGTDKFAQGNVAMITGGQWYYMIFPDLLKNNTVGIVPFPRDPNTDTYYMQESVYGWTIPKDAKNPEGAGAFILAARYDSLREDLKFQDPDSPWTKEWDDAWQANLDKIKPVGVPISYISFQITDFYGDIFARPRDGEPWATIAEEISPKIDDKIDSAYEA